MKRALITGITGQDGAYLAEFLANKGYQLFGTYRRSSTPNFWRLQALDILQKVTLIPSDLTDMSSLLEAVTISDPHEIYNLAAQSYVGASFDQPMLTAEVDGTGTLRFLEIIRHLKKNIKLYQASTSELYGDSINRDGRQDEETKFLPNSPYAAAKLYGYHIVKIYREAYGIFASNGILFNHESPLRGLEFVTRKITNAVGKIKSGFEKKLKLGNLESARDWGYAPEYVEAMWLILQQSKADDYETFAQLVEMVISCSPCECRFWGRQGALCKDNILISLDIQQICRHISNKSIPPGRKYELQENIPPLLCRPRPFQLNESKPCHPKNGTNQQHRQLEPHRTAGDQKLSCRQKRRRKRCLSSPVASEMPASAAMVPHRFRSRTGNPNQRPDLLQKIPGDAHE